MFAFVSVCYPFHPVQYKAGFHLVLQTNLSHNKHLDANIVTIFWNHSETFNSTVLGQRTWNMVKELNVNFESFHPVQDNQHANHLHRNSTIVPINHICLNTVRPSLSLPTEDYMLQNDMTSHWWTFCVFHVYLRG